MNLVATIGLCELVGLAPRVAYAITLAFLIVFNFCAARRYVYQSTTVPWLQQFGLFVGAVGLFRVLEYAFYSIAVGVLAVDYRIAIVILNPCFAVAKYVWLRTHVFQQSSPINVATQVTHAGPCQAR